MKKLMPLFCLGLLMLAFFPTAGHATCTSINTLSGSIEPPPGNVLYVPSYTPVGTILYSTQKNMVGSGGNFGVSGCDAPGTMGGVNFIGSQPNLVLNSKPVYPTSVPGIGYQVYADCCAGYGDATDSDGFYTVYPTAYAANTGANYYTFNNELVVRFVKTGDIEPGEIKAGLLWEYRVDGAQPPLRISLASPIVVAPEPCTIVSSSIDVSLPTIRSYDLPSVGSVAGLTPFNISFNCSVATPINIRIDSNDFSLDSAGSLSNVANAGAASGVGVRLLDQELKLVPLGTSVLKGPFAKGTANIPFSAEYIRTGVNMAPGAVKAIAYFTLAYY